MTNVTWKALSQHDRPDPGARKDLPNSVFAFPAKRKEPLTDAAHVRAALSRFDQVTDVNDRDRDQAFANIRAAAAHYGVHVAEDDWRDLGRT